MRARGPAECRSPPPGPARRSPRRSSQTEPRSAFSTCFAALTTSASIVIRSNGDASALVTSRIASRSPTESGCWRGRAVIVRECSRGRTGIRRESRPGGRPCPFPPAAGGVCGIGPGPGPRASGSVPGRLGRVCHRPRQRPGGDRLVARAPRRRRRDDERETVGHPGQRRDLAPVGGAGAAARERHVRAERARLERKSLVAQRRRRAPRAAPSARAEATTPRPRRRRRGRPRRGDRGPARMAPRPRRPAPRPRAPVPSPPARPPRRRPR